MGKKKDSKVTARFVRCEVCQTPMQVVQGRLRPDEGHQVVVAQVDGENQITIHSTDCVDRLPGDMLTTSVTAEQWSLGGIGE